MTRLRYIVPAAPVLVRVPPTGSEWLHEIKWDGWRIQIIRDAQGIRIFSRNRVDWCDRLPDIAEAANALDGRRFIIDAELVGSGSFYDIHKSIRRREVHAFAFDLMHLNGIDLCSQMLVERKQKLETLLAGSGDGLQLAEVFSDGPALVAAAIDNGFEGIVSKRRASLYRSGRCLDWLKLKTDQWSAANKHRHRLFERRNLKR